MVAKHSVRCSCRCGANSKHAVDFLLHSLRRRDRAKRVLVNAAIARRTDGSRGVGSVSI